MCCRVGCASKKTKNGLDLTQVKGEVGCSVHILAPGEIFVKPVIDEGLLRRFDAHPTRQHMG